MRYLLLLLTIITAVSCSKFTSNTKKDKVVCYTNGVYDMYHIGHMNILRNAKSICDVLIAGVHPDELVQKSKNKTPIVPFAERMEVVRSIKYVDVVVQDDDYFFDNPEELYQKYKINKIIMGGDHVSDYKNQEERMKKYNVEFVFFPYTQSQSSTKLRNKLKQQ